MSANVQLVKDSDQSAHVGFTQQQHDLLKRMICKTATEDELKLFIDSCIRTKLDPFIKQIYLLKFAGTMTIMVSIDGLRLIAERTGRYMPGREPTYVYDKTGNLFSATSYVKKRATDGSWHECAATAHFNEYKGGNVWNSKPHVMLAKCAEALVLRKAFPSDMSGLYTEDEMEQVKAMNKDAFDVSACEKVDLIHQKSPQNRGMRINDNFPIKKYQEINKELIDRLKKESEEESENAMMSASLKDIIELERDINTLITPHDPDYISRMLTALGIDSISKMTEEHMVRVRKNMAKKVRQLKGSPEGSSGDVECPF